MLDTILNLFQSFVLVKIAIILVITFFIVFLLIVFNQTKAMSNLISVEGSTLIQTLALLLLTIEITIFVAALVIL